MDVLFRLKQAFLLHLSRPLLQNPQKYLGPSEPAALSNPKSTNNIQVFQLVGPSPHSYHLACLSRSYSVTPWLCSTFPPPTRVWSSIFIAIVVAYPIPRFRHLGDSRLRPRRSILMTCTTLSFSKRVYFI